MKVDDPVGAVGVHGLCGATGTMLTGIFAYYSGNEITKEGLIYGGGFGMLGGARSSASSPSSRGWL